VKIFVTVGTQLPFDRLISTVDGWAARNPQADVFAQIGPTSFRPAHIQWVPFLNADECQKKVEQANIIVAHAGMGSIITALEIGKRIIVMPRRAVHNEHRNDHQIATARSLLAQGHVLVAFDEHHLIEKLDNIERLAASPRIARHGSPRLLAVIREFIAAGVAAKVETQHQEESLDAPGFGPDRPIAPKKLPEVQVSTEGFEAELTPFAVQTHTDIDSLSGRSGAVLATFAPPTRGLNKAIMRRTIIRSRRPGKELSPLLKNLGGLILLEGAVRRSTFSHAIRRSLMELPIDSTRSILDLWQQQLKALANSLDIERLPCRIVAGHRSRPPRLRPNDVAADVSIERDPTELRGTGGLLRDIGADYDDEVTLIVANAAQVLTCPLHELLSDAAKRKGDVTIVGNYESVPPTMTLIKCAALKQIPETGYIDLKEQGLAIMAKRHNVVVHREAKSSGLPVRTPNEYLSALRAIHRVEAGRSTNLGPFAERWHPEFAVVENGAVIAPDARLHDAVVLAGACAEAGCAIVRSIICGGTRVAANSRNIDRLLTPGGSIALESKP
jgi:UDP-N-acetylglucosamine transferase subunit ALG13